MFDLIKRLLGRSGCSNCIHRRMWGLYCGFKKTKSTILPSCAWQKYGCWHYVDERLINWKVVCAKCADGEIEPDFCEYFGEPNGCNSPIYGEHPKKKGEAAHGIEPEEALAATAKRAWSVELDYKGADPADKGSWGAFVAYRDLGTWAVIMPTYDAMNPGQKGVEMGVDYVFAKNIMGTAKYFFGKEVEDDVGGEAPMGDVYTFFGELNFFF